jgi:cell division protein FtsA
VWHTAIIPVGGWHVTNDIAQLLHLPFEVAEGVKKTYGNASPREVDPKEIFHVQPFGEEQMSQVLRADLAHIVHSRIEELFQLVLKEVKYSAYDGLLSAGAVLTGGVAQLPGIKQVAADVLKMPVRVAQPERISGTADQLRNPSYSTSVGLLRLGLMMDQDDDRRGRSGRPVRGGPSSGSSGNGRNGGYSGGSDSAGLGKALRQAASTLMKRLLPEDEEN